MELENHFYIAENTLYTWVSNKIDEIFQIVIEEHKSISMLVESLRTNADLEDKLDRIAIVLENHIKLEERILFPKVKDSLSKDALMKLAEDLEKNGYLNI
jgi:hemerythrin superfamily protein